MDFSGNERLHRSYVGGIADLGAHLVGAQVTVLALIVMDAGCRMLDAG
jgi:hypothetical protein